MTPNYASPEQIRGEAATTSLGHLLARRVLYELLTGICPRRFESLTPLAIERSLDRPIVRPSAAVGDARLRAPARRRSRQHPHARARDRSGAPLRVGRAARGRSATASGAPADPGAAAHGRLSGGDVRASASRIDSRGGGSLCGLVGGDWRCLVQKPDSPTSGCGKSARSRSKLVFDVHDAVRDLPGSTKARQLIVQTGINYLDELVRSAGRDPHAQTELAVAYRRLGDVQGNVDSANLGDLPSALAQYQKALPLLDDAIRQGPKDIERTHRAARRAQPDRDAAGGDREAP